VSRLHNDYARTVLGVRHTELWCLVLNHQCHHRCLFPISFRPCEHLSKGRLLSPLSDRISDHWRASCHGVGWVVVGKNTTLLSHWTSVVHLVFEAFFTMLVGLAMAGTYFSAHPERIAFVMPNFRDLQRPSNQWRPIFLGGHDFQASGCSLRILGHELVQPSGSGCGNDRNQV
jgi:hypothetical protein